MKNFETGKKLIEEAQEYLGEMKRAYRRGSWNVTIRRAQEVVELGLKGLIKIMGAEYPKVHDPMEFVIRTLQRSKIEIKDETKERLKRISAELAEKRAPAFYFERVYSEKEAKEAKDGAEFVWRIIKQLHKRLTITQ